MARLAAKRHGFEVEQFTHWHFRINGRLDVWPETGMCMDIITKEKSKLGYAAELNGELEKFVKAYFEKLGTGYARQGKPELVI